MLNVPKNQKSLSFFYETLYLVPTFTNRRTIEVPTVVVIVQKQVERCCKLNVAHEVKWGRLKVSVVGRAAAGGRCTTCSCCYCFQWDNFKHEWDIIEWDIFKQVEKINK